MITLLCLLPLAPALPQVELVSKAATPQLAVPGEFMDASDDGRYVLISSDQRNVIAGQVDPEHTPDLFLVDRATGVTRLVTHAGDDVTGTGGGKRPNAQPDAVISGDGSVVVYSTAVMGLVPGFDSLGRSQTYRYQVSTGVNTAITRSASNPLVGGDQRATGALVSQDGMLVVVSSLAGDLLPGFVAGSNAYNLFAYDLQNGTVSVVSHAQGAPLAGSGVASANRGFALDDAGLTVSFDSYGTDLVVPFQPPSAGFHPSVYVHDLTSSLTTLLSHEAGAPTVAAATGARNVGMSADGQRLIFRTETENIVPGQVNPIPGQQLYLHDRTSGLNALVTHAAGDVSRAANGVLDEAILSADGGRIALSHTGTDLMLGVTDINSGPDLFMYNTATGIVENLLSHRAGLPLVPSFSSELGDFAISGDGSLVGVTYGGTEWISGFSHPTTFSRQNSYAYDLVTGARTLLSSSAASPLIGANGRDVVVGVARNRTTIFRESAARNLAIGSPGGPGAVVATEHPAGNSSFVVTVGGTPSASGNSVSETSRTRKRMISHNGRLSLIHSGATNLAPGPAGGSQLVGPGLFLRDQADGSTRLINHSGDGVTSTGLVREAEISRDGSTVVFSGTHMSNIVPGFVAGETESVFAYDVASGSCRLLSGWAFLPSFESNGDSRPNSISRDGRFIVIETLATDIVSGIADVNGHPDLVLWDGLSGTRSMITRSVTVPGYTANRGALLNFYARDAKISPDGTVVVFESGSTNLVSGFVDRNGNGVADIFAFDVPTSTVRLVSHRFGFPLETGDSYSQSAKVGADGSILFRSAATDLVQGMVKQNGTGYDCYLMDPSGGLTLAIPDMTQPLAGLNGNIWSANLSGDGSAIVFSTPATNLVPGFVDLNGSNEPDIYFRDLVLGTTQLVSHQLTGSNVGSDVRSTAAAISDDARRVVWWSHSENIVVNQAAIGVRYNLFLTDVGTGSNQLVTERLPSSQGPYIGAFDPWFDLSGDGSCAYFTARENKFVELDLNNQSDVFRVDFDKDPFGVQICGTTPNSVGQGAILCLAGSEVAAANLFTASVSELPAQSNGLMLASMETGFVANPGGSLGDLCINGATLGRYIGALQNSGASGLVSMDLDLTRIPSGGQLAVATSGSAFAWQYWYRDLAGGAAVSNLSDARFVRFR